MAAIACSAIPNHSCLLEGASSKDASLVKTGLSLGILETPAPAPAPSRAPPVAFVVETALSCALRAAGIIRFKATQVNLAN